MQRTTALAAAALRCLAAAVSAGPSIPARALSALSCRPNTPAARLFLPPVFDHSRGYARRASKTPTPSKDDDDDDGGDEDDGEIVGEDDFDSDDGDWSEFPDEDDDSYDSEPGTYNSRKRR